MDNLMKLFLTECNFFGTPRRKFFVNRYNWLKKQIRTRNVLSLTRDWIWVCFCTSFLIACLIKVKKMLRIDMKQWTMLKQIRAGSNGARRSSDIPYNKNWHWSDIMIRCPSFVHLSITKKKALAKILVVDANTLQHVWQMERWGGEGQM